MKKVFKYIFGTLFTFSGVQYLIGGEIAQAIIFSIIGLIILPPISEALKQKLKMWNKRGIRFVVYIILLGGLPTVIESSKAFMEIEEAVEEMNIPTDDQIWEQVRQSSKRVNWSSKIELSDILGSWSQLKYYNTYNPNDVTVIKEASEEQKILVLSKSKYQTSYPFGSGDNPKFDYILKGDELFVVSSKQKLKIYEFKVSINDSKDKLRLEEISGLVQVYKRILKD